GSRRVDQEEGGPRPRQFHGGVRPFRFAERGRRGAPASHVIRPLGEGRSAGPPTTGKFYAIEGSENETPPGQIQSAPRQIRLRRRRFVVVRRWSVRRLPL